MVSVWLRNHTAKMSYIVFALTNADVNNDETKIYHVPRRQHGLSDRTNRVFHRLDTVRYGLRNFARAGACVVLHILRLERGFP
jgi:hypothetical protein